MFRSFFSTFTIAAVLLISASNVTGQQCHGKKGGGHGGNQGGGYPPYGGGQPPIYNPQPLPPFGGGGYPDPYGNYPGNVVTYPESSPYAVQGNPIPVNATTVPASVTKPSKHGSGQGSAEDESSFESLDSMMDETMEGVEWDVLVEHPTRGEFTKVKTFSKEAVARRFVNSLEHRYWIVYKSSDAESSKFEEAKNATDAKAVVTRLRQKGFEVEKPTPVTAKLVLSDVSSLLAEDADSAIQFEKTSQSKQTDEVDLNVADVTPTTPENSTASSAAVPNGTATSFLDSALVPLLGMWKAVARDAEGQLTTNELKLDANGWATLVMPSENGGTTTLERRVALENGELKLSNENSTVTLGKLANADANRLTLERANGQVTFVRP